MLFVRTGCEFCHEAQELVREVTRARVAVYEVFQSRVDGMLEIRSRSDVKTRKPLLIKDDVLTTVPCLYDPTEDEFVPGIENIREYLTDSGLIS